MRSDAAGLTAHESADDWTLDEWRKVLANAIDAVFVRPAKRRKLPAAERTRIVWRGTPGWSPDDLPQRGRQNGPIRPFTWDDGPTSAGEARG